MQRRRCGSTGNRGAAAAASSLSRTRRCCRIRTAAADLPEPDDDGPLYAARRQIYPQRVHGTYRRIKWIVLYLTLGIYYFLPFVRWDRGPDAPEPGCAGRSGQQPLLFLLHRDLAAGGLLPHRPADHRRDDAVPDERRRRTHLVRLSLPADGLDRSVPDHRALGRRRSPRAHAARPAALDGRAAGAAPGSSTFSG